MFQSPGKGIGALTVNGNNQTFAFSEEKLSPSIFVYIYPELQLKNELKGKNVSSQWTSVAKSLQMNIPTERSGFIDDVTVNFFLDVLTS